MAKRKNNPDKFRLERASELERFAEVLDKASLVRTARPLRLAAAECRKSKPNARENFWAYHLDNLIIPIGRQDGVIPKKVADRDFVVDLSVAIVGKCLSDHADDHDIDPLRELSINITVRSDGHTEICALHLDRDIRFDADYSPGRASDNPVRASHPVYHFQFGGRGLKAIEGQIAGVFFPEAPRLKYPPLDGILAVDFVLANFNEPGWERLRQADTSVSETVRRLQKLLWRPYLNSLITIWNGPISTRWSPNGIWPQICI